MTLHETVIQLKKVSIASAIGLGCLIALIITIRTGIFIKNVLFPVQAGPANHTFGNLPVLLFPDSVTDASLTYSLNTLSGGFEKFPDRLNVYKIDNPEANFLNLEKAKARAKDLGFINSVGEAVQEVPIGEATYEWSEIGGLQRKLVFNIVTFDFLLSSNYLTSLTVLNAVGLPNEKGAIETTTDFLTTMDMLPTDIDLAKTESTEKTVNYYRPPQLLEVKNGELIQTSSLSNAQVIRVNLYHKDVEYKMDTGIEGKTEEIKLPIVYPNPPFSTMSIWVGMGPQGATAVDAKYSHRSYVVDPAEFPTYEIKTAEEAFEELQNGSGYIAAYNGSSEGGEILINNAYLAYYVGETEQSYLMPIFVFEGDDGFFAYVSAVRNELLE